MITPERADELGKLLAKVLERYPDSDRDTVWRILLDLELTPEERVRRALSLGCWSASRYFSARDEGISPT